MPKKTLIIIILSAFLGGLCAGFIGSAVFLRLATVQMMRAFTDNSPGSLNIRKDMFMKRSEFFLKEIKEYLDLNSQQEEKMKKLLIKSEDDFKTYDREIRQKMIQNKQNMMIRLRKDAAPFLTQEQLIKLDSFLSNLQSMPPEPPGPPPFHGPDDRPSFIIRH